MRPNSSLLAYSNGILYFIYFYFIFIYFYLDPDEALKNLTLIYWMKSIQLSKLCLNLYITLENIYIE